MIEPEPHYHVHICVKCHDVVDWFNELCEPPDEAAADCEEWTCGMCEEPDRDYD